LRLGISHGEQETQPYMHDALLHDALSPLAADFLQTLRAR
jgi:hypothetical protein